MALVYSSSAAPLLVHQVNRILGETDGTAQFIDTNDIVANSDIVTEVSDVGEYGANAVVGPQALKAYYQGHQSIGPRGYQGYQGIPGGGGNGERGYQGWQGNRGYQGVAGTAGSDYWSTVNPNEWTAQGSLYARYHVNAVDFFQGSDDRMKEKVEDIKGALDNIERIPTFKFKFKGQEKDGRIHLGSSAQSLLKVVPEVVMSSKEGRLSVTYPELAVYTLAALKELVAVLKEKKII